MSTRNAKRKKYWSCGCGGWTFLQVSTSKCHACGEPPAEGVRKWIDSLPKGAKVEQQPASKAKSADGENPTASARLQQWVDQPKGNDASRQHGPRRGRLPKRRLRPRHLMARPLLMMTMLPWSMPASLRSWSNTSSPSSVSSSSKPLAQLVGTQSQTMPACCKMPVH